MNMQQPKKRRWCGEGLGLLALFLLALGLRLINLNATSLWIDEIYSLIVANGHLPPSMLDGRPHSAMAYYQHALAWQPFHWPTLLALLKINVHMPLYYCLVNPWLGWMGNDAIGLRSFSALFSALLVFPLYFLGKSLGGKQAGCWAAVFIALVPFQIYYGQEGRMYALSLFGTTVSALSFWKTLHGDKPVRWGLLYALSLIGGFLSHYMFIFFLGFQGVYGGWWIYRSFLSPPGEYDADPLKTKRLLMLAIAGFGVALVGAAWFPIYLAQQQGVDEEYHFAKGLVPPLRYLTVLVWQPLVVIAGDNRLERLFYMPFTVLLLLFYLKQGIFKAKNVFKKDAFWILWVIIPLLLQILYDLWKHTHVSVIDRYAMLISPAMCLGLGLAFTKLFFQYETPASSTHPFTQSQQAFPTRMSTWIQKNLAPRRSVFGYCIAAVMCMMAVGLVWSPSPLRDEHNKDKDIRGKIHFMARQATPHDLIVANGPWGAPNMLAYYLVQEPPPFPQTSPKTQAITPAHPVFPSSSIPILYWVNPYRGKPSPLPAPSLLKPYQRVWLFRYRSNNERGLQTIKDYLATHYPHVQKLKDWFLYFR